MQACSFDVIFANEYGVNEAILFNNIGWWVIQNETNGTNFHDGCYWTYNSYSAFEKQYPFLSKYQIREAMRHLEKEGLILVADYNSDPFNKTRWYTLSDAGRAMFSGYTVDDKETAPSVEEKLDRDIDTAVKEVSYTVNKQTDNIPPKENIKRKTDPASGTPSSPEVDELQVYDLQFESFWDKVQYKAQKSKAYAQWKKATNNGKSQTAIKGIEEGYERYVSFLAKTKKLGFNQSHMLMSRFLNHKDQIWLEDWKTEEEQRQERNKEQQKRFFETKQREEQKHKEQQRNELEEEKRQHLIAITTKYRKYWSDVIKQRFGFDVTTDDIEQHKTDNTDYWIYFEEWCQGRYIADTIGVFTKKGMDYDAIEECFDKRIKTKNTKKTSYRP